MTEETDPLERMIAEWEDRRAKGEQPTASELCCGKSGLTGELQRQIGALQEMDWLDEPLPDQTATWVHALQVVEKPERPIPTRLGDRYELDSLLASGGFGQVWRATDTLLQRTVAVKLTEINCLPEARRVAALKHQGIVSVHDVGLQEGFCFIVFDFVEGGDLAERIRRERPDWRESARIVATVAEYLDYAHQHGLIHRDIKPANILLNRQGAPVLADFGIAMTQQELRTETTTTAGTLPYMSPEQLTVDAAVTPQTDIYSLGVLLYELLTGELPFRGTSIWGLRENILTQPAPAIDDENIPQSLRDLTARCLAKNPADRPATARELAEALRRIE